nr:tetratricopeptide repeat protein [uncultured Flavobacterium sp.]
MKTRYSKYIFVFGAAVFAIACSTKKDNFVNRNYHAMSTKYNVMYNGNNALVAGVAELKANLHDNYWDILPVERMQKPSEEMEPTDKRNANIERAEAKAVKAIQKHSMDIGGQERNPQMDEAYLLLGESRYYDNRFVPAMEAFNYVLYKYPKSSAIDEIKVWREKTNIRLDNTGLAIINLKKLLKEKREVMDKQIFSDANAMLGQAYINEEYLDSAVNPLKQAAKFSRDKEKRARYYFIVGQIYGKLKKNDSSYAYYQHVIDMKRKSPRLYTVQAHAMQAGMFDYKAGDTLAFMKKYKKLLEDRENRPYLDIINHQVALFYDKQGNTQNAVKYYNVSIKKKGNDRYLTASNYRNIAEINFKQAKYLMAGKYYDSTLVNMDFRTREYKSIKKKRNNLDDVIKYEGIASVNDSILHVAGLNEGERIAYYNDYIAKLKIADEEAKKKAEKEAQAKANMEANAMTAGSGPVDMNKDDKSGNAFQPQGVSLAQMGSARKSIGDSPGLSNRRSESGTNGSFYFYNGANIASGKAVFQNKWGKRELTDNWRVASEMSASAGGDTNNEDATDSAEGKNKKDEKPLDPRYDPTFYISQIPTDLKVLDSLAKDRNFAYFQLGAIYKDKFKEYQRAADKLEKLLTYSPEERLIAPSLYNLYRIYEIIDPSKAQAYKQRILSEYPDSRYAAIVKNPNPDELFAGSPEAVYKKVFDQYASGQLREVYESIGQYIDSYEGEDILPKFELLKARVIGRLLGAEEYKKAVNYVALTYANAKEGKEADAMLKKDIPALEKLAFGEKPTAYKLIFKFNANDLKIEKLTKTIKQFIKDGNNNSITLSNDIYSPTENILVVHGLINRLAAVDAATVLRDYKDYRITETPIIISTEDYKVVQVKKNLAQYQPVK